MSATHDLHVETVGEGPPLVWLHGYSMNADVWRPLWNEMPGFCHVGVDLAGHGRSPDLQPGTTLAEMADDVIAVLHRFGASDLVGISMGSMIAFETLRREGSPVRRLAVAAPTLAGMPEAAGTADRYRQLWTLYRGGTPPHIIADFWMESPPHIFTGLRDRPEALESVRDAVARHRWHELATGAMAGLGSAQQPVEDLPGCADEILVISGLRDMPTFRDLAERLGAEVEAVTLVDHADCGHLPPLERPTDFAARLSGFFA